MLSLVGERLPVLNELRREGVPEIMNPGMMQLGLVMAFSDAPEIVAVERLALEMGDRRKLAAEILTPPWLLAPASVSQHLEPGIEATARVGDGTSEGLIGTTHASTTMR
jgi:hypothetical protein